MSASNPVSASNPAAEPTGAEAIVAERAGNHLLIIRMNRPHRRNAFDRATATALEAAIDAYEEDDDLWCAIITGSDTVFSAGQDLIAAASGDMAAGKRRGGFGIMAQPPAKPVIAKAMTRETAIAAIVPLIARARAASGVWPWVIRKKAGVTLIGPRVSMKTVNMNAGVIIRLPPSAF